MSHPKYTYLLITPSILLNKNMEDMIREVISPYCNRICYVTLNKTYNVVRGMIDDLGLSSGKFCFIDGITNAVIDSQSKEDVTFLSHPVQITELENTLNKLIDEGKFDGLIFDSVSTLTVYEKHQSEIILLFSRLVARLAEKKVISIFVALLEDKNKDLVSHMGMNAEVVKEIKERPKIL